MYGGLDYRLIKPDRSLSDFIESFWLLDNRSGSDKEVVVLPDGRVDLILTQSPEAAFHITLLGIGTEPEQAVIEAGRLMFAVSFRLLAIEYIFHASIADLLNGGKLLPADFWGFVPDVLNDFDLFREKVSAKIRALPVPEIDSRKWDLFDRIYASDGAITVKELSDNVFWSGRQINRYFRQQFGIPLKAYCSILRFRASFQHIKEGKLFPEQNFADQSHFIKEVKKLSGVLPKELSRNKNGRFIQFSTLPGK